MVPVIRPLHMEERNHSRVHMVLHVTVDHEGARGVRHRIQHERLSWQQGDGVDAAPCFRHKRHSVPVQRVEAILIPQACHIPPYVIPLPHSQLMKVAVQIAVDGMHLIAFNEALIGLESKRLRGARVQAKVVLNRRVL